MPKNLERAELFVVICQGSDCKKAGAKSLVRQAKRTLKEHKAMRQVTILKTKCTGNCKRAAICGLVPGGPWLEEAEEADLERALTERLEQQGKGKKKGS